MAKVLYIKANPKSVEQSYTFKMSEAFVQTYRKQNPADEIVTIDLYQKGIKPLNAEGLDKIFNEYAAQGKSNDIIECAKEFASADKYIIAAPMWNLSIPAILKAYFDYVLIAGITFKYTEQGPIGLLSGKGRKAVHIVARGGMYSQGPAADFEMGDRYIRIILGFMGITDVKTITTELTGVLKDKQLEESVNASIQEAEKMAKSF